MRLMIVGTLSGQLTQATKIAMDRGAKVTHAEDVEQCLRVLRAGRGADLLMVDVGQPIKDLVRMLEDERIHVPIVACGIELLGAVGIGKAKLAGRGKTEILRRDQALTD